MAQPKDCPVATEPPPQRELICQDQALVRRLLAREESAWSEFVARYDRLVQSRILAACRETGHAAGLRETLADISAEVYAALVDQDMKTLRSYSGRSQLSTWLAVIVRRFTLRHICRLNRLAHDVTLDQCVQLMPEDDHKQQQELLRMVAEARLQLSPSDRQLLRLFYDEAKAYKEIARQLSISVNTVGPKLDRARQRLRKIVEEKV